MQDTMRFIEAAKRMARIALADEGTSGTRRVFVSLLHIDSKIAGQTSIRNAVQALVEEGAKRRHGDYPVMAMPHQAVEILDGLRKAMGLRDCLRPEVLPRTWVHEGIEIGAVVRLGLSHVHDHARRDSEGPGIRIARCRVTEFTSDTTGVHPYVRYVDLDRPNEGGGLIEVSTFRKAMELGAPEPAPLGPRR